MSNLTLFSLLGSILSSHTVILIIAGYSLYYVGLFTYRLSPFHPLHKFPGPRMAAASYLYEMYFDIVKGGHYMFEIKELHAKHGPIIRINPGELHCNDPDFADEIFTTGNRKRDKGPFAGLNLDDATRASSFGTRPHDLHRLRRAPVTKKHSAASITKLEPEIHRLSQSLADKLLASRGAIHVQDAMSCYATDVAALQVFGEPLGYVEQEGFEPNLRRAQYAIFTTYHVFTWCAWIRWAALVAGEWLGRYMPEEIRHFRQLVYIDFPARVARAIQEHDSGVIKSRGGVVDDILDSNLPAHEKTAQRITGEITAILIAGTETTSWVLTTLTYYLLANPQVLARLTAELKGKVMDPTKLPSWSALEQMPYLTSVLLEGLRLSYGLVHRMARVPTGEDLVYRGSWTPPAAVASSRKVQYVVPRGYAIGMSNWITHHDEAIFPDSHSFVPERWVNPDGSRRKDLEKHMNAFSKGSRSCLGMQLAYCELYIMLATLVLRVYPHLELHHTSVDDVRPAADYFLGIPRKGSKGVQAVVKGA